MTDPTVDVLARAMWEALSDRNVVRIDADSGKELFDIADAILAALAAGAGYVVVRKDDGADLSHLGRR